MKRQLGTALLSVATGVATWGVTTALEFLDPAWRIVVAIGVALVTGVIAFIALRSDPEESKKQIASGLKGKNVRISDIKATNDGKASGQSIASNIRASGDIEIDRIQDEPK